MPKTTHLFVLLPLALAAVLAANAAPPAGRTAEAEVRAVIERLYETAEARDWQAMSELLSDDFVLYTDQASTFDRGSYLELLASDDLGVEEMELRDLEIRVADDGSLAWCRFTGYFVHSPEYVVETAETLAFERLDGAWKVAHSHASVKVLGGDEEAGR